MQKHLFTSESVTEGHPDKICDQIADAVLDDILSKDPDGRVACEVTVNTGMVYVMGEISTSCYVDIPAVARQVVQEIGYTRAKYGFDYETCAVITSIKEQSRDIAMGVDTGGAGDQGLMFGYACDETKALMPLPISLAHELAKQLAHVRKAKILPLLRPDGKSQVTVEYEGDSPVRVDTVVISAQHSPEYELDRLKAEIIQHVIRPIIPPHMIDSATHFLINPTGRFVTGGPQGDTGLSGRKIIVDTYGGYARHGGGSFSGKDPSKVDRSGAYAARWVAKHIVKAGLAKRCEVQVAYAIGVAKPVSILVETFGTAVVPVENIEKAVREIFVLTPTAIIRSLNLKQPIYRPLASYGQVGREDLGVLWEQTPYIEELKNAAHI